MTPPDTSFKWFLLTFPENFRTAHDEFLAEGFRIRLMGNMLEVSFEAQGTCSPDSARVLAEKYVGALGKRLLTVPVLITEAEWIARTTPPFQGYSTVLSDREDQNRIVTAVSEARNELLASADEALRRCYNYLQDAHEHMNEATDQTSVSAYKALEELEQSFGGEAEAVAALGKEFKVAKRVANQPRHIEGKYELMPNPPASPLGLATNVIRSYERYLLGLP